MSRKISVEIVGDSSQLERTFGRAAKSANGFNRDLSHATRGALAGSGAFRSLGRSIAFASGGFLAFASAGQFLRTSIDAAKEAQVTQKQLGAQFKASGLDLKDYQGAIDKTANRLALLAGFENDEIKAGFTTIFRTTGNVSKALRDTATAADLARAKHLGFAQASLIIAKTEANNTTLLRRQGFQIAKNATAEEALAKLRRIVAGQAKAGTTAQERFGAVLHNTEEIIGLGILPTLNKYLSSASIWLTQMNESGRLQKDVNHIMGDAKKIFHDVGAVAKFVADRFRELNHVTGSLENTLKILVGLKVASSLAGWVGGLGGVGAAAGEAGAAGKVGLLTSRLRTLALLGAAGIAIDIIINEKSIKNKVDKKVGTSSGHSNLDDLLHFGSGTGEGSLLGKALFPGYWNGQQDMGPTGGLPGHMLPFPGGSVVKRLTGNRQSGAAAQTARNGLSLGGQFNLAELKLADAQRANNTKLQRSILASEEAIVLKLRDQAKTLKDRTKYAQQAASIQSSIEGIDQAAAEKAKAAAAKRKAAAAKVAAGGVPLALQLAQAKADAIAAGANAQDMTKGQIRVAKQIRSYEMKAIKSHRLSMQGLIDAWSEIGSINSQLAGAGKGMIGTYHHAATSALTKGLGLSRDAAVQIRERAAQRDAHRGYVPSGPAALGQPVHIGVVNVHGVQNIDKLASELDKAARRKPRRGQR